MKLVIQSIDFEIDDTLKKYIENAIFRPVSSNAAIRYAEILLFEEEHDGVNKKTCSIRAVLEATSYLIKKYANSFEESILMSIDDLLKKIISDSSGSN